MRKLCILIVIVLFSNTVFSQDVIHLKGGEKIEAKVIEVGVTEIRYKKIDFQEGPDYVVHKTKVEYIYYSNGQKDVFYKKKNTENYKALCKRKIRHYGKQKKYGLAMAGIGVIGTTVLAVNFENRPQLPYPDNISQGVDYGFGFVIGAGVIIGGGVLYLTGNQKVKQYSKKLKLGVNLSQKQKGISLVYRF